MTDPRTFLVTATPPTPNGELHVGHLSGPFLAADVFNRFQKMSGNRSIYVTSSDDHQSYVQIVAERQRREPAELAGAYADAAQATLAAAEIQIDCFTRALGNSAHIEFTQAFFVDLVARGIVVSKRAGSLYCGRCERFLFEGFVRGWCPHCGEETPGHLCEMCGRVSDPTKLIEPSCSICLEKPAEVEREGLYLPLEPHRRRLESFWEGRTSWRPHLHALCDAMLGEELPDYPVSHPGPWGIPVPIRRFEDQVINVWLEMYPGHVHTASTHGARSADPGLEAQLRAGELTLVQFLGHDNSFFNAVLHTAIALALDGSWPVPEHVVTNEFYFLEDRKFSTSRNHTIPGQEVLSSVGPDSLRFHLARTNPEHWQTNFSWGELMHTEKAELGGVWSAALDGLFHLALSASPGEPAGGADLQAKGLIGWAAAGLERFYGIDEFSLRHASAVLGDFVQAGGEYARRARPAECARGHSPQSRSAAALLRSLAIFSAPLMPAFAQRVWDGLGLRGAVADQSWDAVRA